MVTNLDICIGDVYALTFDGEDGPILADFAKEMRDGRLMFKREGTDRELYVTIDEFEQMRCDGRADRVRLDPQGMVVSNREIDPEAFADPEEPGITLAEHRRRLRQQDIIHRKQTLRFYLTRYDAESCPSRGRAGVTRFIKRQVPDAREAGYHWIPSPSSLLRAADEYGEPGHRDLVYFLPDRTKERLEKRWPKGIVMAACEAIETYWDDPTVAIGDAIAMFKADASALADSLNVPMKDEEDRLDCDSGEPDDDLFVLRNLVPEGEASKQRTAKQKPGYPIPSDETIRLWLHKHATWENWASRYGLDNANRRFRGRGKAIEASRPLEYVMFDHTMLDVWSVVHDDDGHPLFVARAWLTVAIDLYSRMILGAVIGYEPPSIKSVISCLRQVVRRKDFLLDTYGEWKGASDGWGRPFTVIVDNGKEFVSPSFQASCAAVGIDVIWAPIKRPTYKAHVERFFGTLNQMLWHKLPGGLPLTPQQRQQLGLEPEAEAAFSRTQLEQAMWNVIVTRYHVETHSGIGMAPALKWSRGLATYKRATVDKTSLMDAVVGRTKRVLLTAEGVTVGGHRFHDPTITTMLMNRLARFGKERQQRRGVTSSRTVWVRATWDDGDVGWINIWDPTTGTSVKLPNWSPLFSQGLSWYAAKMIREWAEERNQAFHSDAEKAAARVAHREFLLDVMPNAKSIERRRRARQIEPQKALTSGNRVEIKSMSRDDDRDIQHDTAMARAPEAIPVKKGRPIGGQAGQKKAQETKRQNREQKQDDAAKKANKPSQLPSVSASKPSTADIAAIKARVAARMNKKSDGEAA